MSACRVRSILYEKTCFVAVSSSARLSPSLRFLTFSIVLILEMAANHSESDYTNVNHGANLLLVLWLTSSVALAFVVVRVFVRVKLLDYHGWDDYSIIISIVC